MKGIIKGFILSILAVFCFVVSGCSELSMIFNQPLSEENSSMTVPDNNDDFLYEDIVEPFNMSLKIQRLSDNEEISSSEVSLLSDDSYLLTATVLPENAENKTVTYSIAWENESSTWATSKIVTDYVTLVQTSEGSLTATVTCVKAFCEPIIVTVTSNENLDAYATARLDYEQKVKYLRVDCLLATSGAFYGGDLYFYSSDGVGNFTCYYVINRSIEGDERFVFLQLFKYNDYTIATDYVGYMEFVPTQEFSNLCQDLGVTADIYATDGEVISSGSNKSNAFYIFDFWGKPCIETKFSTTESYNSFVRACWDFEGSVFYNLNVYTHEGGEKLCAFDIIMDAGEMILK